MSAENPHRVFFLFANSYEVFGKSKLEKLKYAYQDGKSIKDLADLINFVLQCQNETIQTNYTFISSKQLAYYAAKRDEKYIHFEILKKTGGSRTISTPFLFKTSPKTTQYHFGLVFCASLFCKCFIKHRSILTNAQKHIGKNMFIILILQDFFPTVHYGRLKSVLQLDPFYASPELAHLIAHLACFKKLYPQGAPTSHLLTNAVCQSLDRLLVELAKHYRCHYSRYVDDITFSSTKIFLKKGIF